MSIIEKPLIRSAIMDDAALDKLPHLLADIVRHDRLVHSIVDAAVVMLDRAKLKPIFNRARELRAAAQRKYHPRVSAPGGALAGA
jgi:hypothetical protein